MNIANEKISVVIPAYNAEMTIETCLRSLQRQYHRRLEIIVVDDHSGDRTGEIVSELANSDPRIRYVRAPQHVGVHNARRLGVAASDGGLIGFVDADDHVEPRMYSMLHSRIVEVGASVAICSASLVSKGQVLGRRIRIRSPQVLTEKILNAFCRHKLGSGVLWNKLYRRDAIEEAALIELERAVDASEDYIVNFGAFARAPVVALCPEPLYNYVVHSSNASGLRGWSAFARLFRGYVVCLEKYARRDPSYPGLIDQLYLKQLHNPIYVTQDEPPDGISEHIAASLRRLADASPTSIYQILHSLPFWYARIERVLTTLRHLDSRKQIIDASR